ncbi:docking protein 3-like [Mercenaria mercenaria]|uniref:docking protein 3-like n=1 Tax=Mercenaria mercenaria TaxID=6596 RepID=UPI00234E74B8|nr:docking protein 3-like [Mercenaria mercenaria]
MDESTLVKSGELCYQEKRFMKSSWVKKFCVLHKKTADSHAYMELYDDQEAFKQHKKKNKKCEKRIELQHVRSIKSSSESTGKGMEHHIEIKLKLTQKHNLMFSKESDFTDWFAKLNSSVDIAEHGPGENSASYSGDIYDSDDDDDDDEVITLNQMYASTDQAQRFEVEVESSDLAKLCGIEGKMMLLVGNNDLAFEDPKTKRVKYSFQLAWMRRFGKYKQQSFNFEVGRKCPNGEGSVTCITPSAKLIHKTVTQKSSSRSKLVIPHPHTEEEMGSRETKPASPSVSSMDEKQAEPSPPVKERQASNISQPIVNSLVRKHPGKANIPSLIPIGRPPIEEEETFKKPKTPPHPARRSSKGKLRNSGKESPEDERLPSLEENGNARSTSYKVAVNSGDFTKELEQKLHVGNDESGSRDQEKGHDPGKKDSVKTKEDKKREKEEKKERERREKEEKKERERKEKEMEKERKLREKEEKKGAKKDKNRDSNKSQEISSKPRQMNERIYDEPEITITPSSADDPNSLYDEAVSPTQSNAPAVYAQSAKRSVRVKKTEDLYDEAVSADTGKMLETEKVEYAEPYSKKGGVPLAEEPAMYADVKTVGKDAWKKLGRKEEEEFFEEDYSNIKSAREIVQKQKPPPIPAKNYGDDDDSENMYNTLDLKKPKASSKSKPENLYGMASAKEVGKLPDIVQVPEADYPSDSGESLPEEEATYDEAQYEGYEAPADIKKDSTKRPKVIEAYEVAEVPVKPQTPKKQTQSKKVVPQELIYEEVS